VTLHFDRKGGGHDPGIKKKGEKGVIWWGKGFKKGGDPIRLANVNKTNMTQTEIKDRKINKVSSKGED